MNIHYTGKQQALTPSQQKKLEVRFARLSKLLDSRRGEKEAHVILTSERHLHRAEITVNFYDHPMVGIGSDPDQFSAISTALDRLGKQLLKQRAKWRDTKRGPAGFKAAWTAEAESEEALLARAEAGEESTAAKKVFRVNHHGQRKPMTLEEALLEMEDDRDYLVYRDAETERVSILVRRRDGNFDLIEA